MKLTLENVNTVTPDKLAAALIRECDRVLTATVRHRDAAHFAAALKATVEDARKSLTGDAGCFNTIRHGLYLQARCSVEIAVRIYIESGGTLEVEE